MLDYDNFMKKIIKEGICWYSWELLDSYGITAGTSCRETVEGENFNLALHTPDIKERVIRNRKKLTDALTLPSDSFTAGEQVHSCNSRILGSEKIKEGEGCLKETDALILTDSALLGVIFTADCLPVILYDLKKETGAVIHAGWKGAAGGIVPLSIKKMERELGCSPAQMLAVGGPAIGPCCYQVDRPVFERLTKAYPETSDAFSPDGTKHWRLSLEEAVKLQMISAGICPDRIEMSGLCTSCHKDFFSWRRDGSKTGRIATFLRTRSREI